MSRSDRQHGAGGADSKRNRAERAAAMLRPAIAKVRPLARRADATTRHQASKAGAWVGPQLERAGQVLEDNIAPKVSGLLSAAARKVEPSKVEPKTQRQPRWRKLTVGASAATAAAGALAAAARRRGKRADAAPEPADAAPEPADAAREPADVTGSEATDQTPGEQLRTSEDAAEEAATRTS
jgi:hypothetical protein